MTFKPSDYQDGMIVIDFKLNKMLRPGHGWEDTNYKLSSHIQINE
ncbi:MAG: hypothetical protein AAF847_00215 [Bacteroidota bacterium]